MPRRWPFSRSQQQPPASTPQTRSDVISEHADPTVVPILRLTAEDALALGVARADLVTVTRPLTLLMNSWTMEEKLRTLEDDGEILASDLALQLLQENARRLREADNVNGLNIVETNIRLLEFVRAVGLAEALTMIREEIENRSE